MKKMNELKWTHVIELPNGSSTPGTFHHGNMTSEWGIPETLKNKRVLVLNSGDGLFAFECEKRGAKSVLAIDKFQNSLNPDLPEEPFYFAKDALNSTVELKKMDVMDLTSFNIGQFELVLCFNVLDNIENPISGIEKAFSVITPSGAIIIETAVKNNESDTPQLTPVGNVYHPNSAWLTRELKRLGCNSITTIHNKDGRIVMKGEK